MESKLHSFYLARAADSERAAEAATLANVRERHLVAALTWTDLATRTGRVESMRTRITAEKQAERAAE